MTGRFFPLEHLSDLDWFQVPQDFLHPSMFDMVLQDAARVGSLFILFKSDRKLSWLNGKPLFFKLGDASSFMPGNSL